MSNRSHFQLERYVGMMAIKNYEGIKLFYSMSCKAKGCLAKTGNWMAKTKQKLHDLLIREKAIQK